MIYSSVVDGLTGNRVDRQYTEAIYEVILRPPGLVDAAAGCTSGSSCIPEVS